MRLLAWDVETAKIQPGLLAPPLVCISFAQPDREPWLLETERGLDELEAALDQPDTILVAHNATFDLAVVCAARPSLTPKVFAAYEAGRIRCTQTRQELLDIAAGLGIKTAKDGDDRRPIVWRVKNGQPLKSGHSLADLVFYFFDLDRSHEKSDPNGWRLRYAELLGVPADEYPPDARAYAIQDSVDALRLVDVQGGPDLLPDELAQNRRAWALHLISVWGMRANHERVEALGAWAEGEYLQLRERMLTEGFYDVVHLRPAEIRDGKQPECVDAKGRPARYKKNTKVVQDRVVAAYAAQGLEAPMSDPSSKFPAGQIKTDADTLEQTKDPLLMELGGAGPVGTIRNTFLPLLRQGAQAPINTRYRLLETGRISSSSPNLNNLARGIWSKDDWDNMLQQIRNAPDAATAERIAGLLRLDVRACFEPRPGFVYCSVDYDCAELRALGQVCLWLFGKSELAAFFQREPHGDPHLELAASMLGISYADAVKRSKAKDPVVKNARQASKAINFGFPGGLGVDTFIESARKTYGVTFTRREAMERKEQWFKRWPEMRRYFEYINAKVGSGGAQIMQLRPGGLPHRMRGNVGYCDGANGYFQGLIADGAAHALWLVSKECYVDAGTALFGCRPVAFLYDEVIAEIPADNMHDAAHRLRDVWVAGMQEWLPDVPVTASPALMTRWHKGAEPTYDANGKLIPWEPKDPLALAAELSAA